MSKNRRYADSVMKYISTNNHELTNNLRNSVTKFLNPSELDTLSVLLESYNLREEREEVGRILLKKLHKVEVRRAEFPEIFDSFQRKLDNMDILKRRRFDPQKVALEADTSLRYSQTERDYDGPPVSLSDQNIKKIYGLREPTV